MKPGAKQPRKKWIQCYVRRLSSLGILTFILVFNLSCVTSKSAISVVTSQVEKPGWIDVLPHSYEKIYFLGQSSYADSLKEGIDQAKKSALSNISEYLGVSVQSTFERYATNDGSHAHSQIRSSSESTIVGAVLEDTYHIKRVRQGGALTVEKFDVYVLLSYSKSRAQNEISRKEQKKRERIVSANQLLKKGRGLEKAEKYSLAMGSYMKAQELLQGLDLVMGSGSEKLDSRILFSNITNRMAIIREINSRISVSVWVDGDLEKKSVFVANLVSALTQQGFSVTQMNPSYRVVADIRTSKVGYTMGNYVYLASGKVSAVQLSFNKEIAAVVVSSKGFS